MRSEFDPHVLHNEQNTRTRVSTLTVMTNNEEGNDSCMYYIYKSLFCTYIVDGALAQTKISRTSIKIVFLNEGDIGMANYEKQVEQEAAYPIPISLYKFYRTVRHEKRGIAILLIAFLIPHCPVTVVQRYWDGICSLLFHNLPSLYPKEFIHNCT